MKLLAHPWLHAGLIFFAGLIAGVMIGNAHAKRQQIMLPDPEALASQIERKLARKLALNEEQQETTARLVRRSIRNILEIHAETVSQIDAELLAAQNALVSDLTPEQIEKLRHLARDRQEFLREHAPMAPTGL